MRDLRAGKYAPVYILMGEEAYYIDKISDFIAENALTPEERDFNLSVVFGLDVQPGQIVDIARRYPLMAARQVVIVKEAQNIKDWDRLELYVEKPVKSTVLVICYKNGTIDRRKKIITKAAAQGVVFVSEKKKYDNEIESFIREYVKTNTSATIDDKAVTMLKEHIGNDLNRMASEIDKLLLSLTEDKKRITPELVEYKTGISKDFNAFELKDAIVKRDIMKANQIIDYFKDNPKAQSVYVVIPTLFSYFQNLLLAHFAPQPYREDSVAEYLGLKSAWSAQDYVKGVGYYNKNKVIGIISKLREMDAKSKGLDNPNTPIGELLKELVFYILH